MVHNIKHAKLSTVKFMLTSYLAVYQQERKMFADYVPYPGNKKNLIYLRNLQCKEARLQIHFLNRIPYSPKGAGDSSSCEC